MGKSIPTQIEAEPLSKYPALHRQVVSYIALKELNEHDVQVVALPTHVKQVYEQAYYIKKNIHTLTSR